VTTLRTTESTTGTASDELSFFARTANAISHAAGRPIAFIISCILIVV
jgi:hypothetical protein